MSTSDRLQLGTALVVLRRGGCIRIDSLEGLLGHDLIGVSVIYSQLDWHQHQHPPSSSVTEIFTARRGCLHPEVSLVGFSHDGLVGIAWEPAIILFDLLVLLLVRDFDVVGIFYCRAIIDIPKSPCLPLRCIASTTSVSTSRVFWYNFFLWDLVQSF